jgi:hypothetical protein
MLENLLKYYRKSDGATKKKILFSTPNLPAGLALPKRIREGDAGRRIKVATRFKISCGQYARLLRLLH